jgi:AcrR family transcriptional regulator
VGEATRDRIVGGAWRVLERDGYAAASIKSIAAEAGVAQGLVHYYFASKELLVVEAVRRCCDQLSALDTAGDAAAVARTGFGMARAHAHTPEVQAARRVLLEMAGRALHDEAIRQALLVYFRTERTQVQEAVDAVLQHASDVPEGLARQVGPALEASLFGIWAIGLIDPEFDATAAVDALAELSLRALSTLTTTQPA